MLPVTKTSHDDENVEMHSYFVIHVYKRVNTTAWTTRQHQADINSFAPGRFEWNFRYVVFKWNLMIDSLGISCEIAPILLSLDFTGDQSTLVQVMAWCRQATSHYLSQCWPRYMSPYGVTRPQWVKSLWQPLHFQYHYAIKQRIVSSIVTKSVRISKKVHLMLFLD